MVFIYYILIWDLYIDIYRCYRYNLGITIIVICLQQIVYLKYLSNITDFLMYLKLLQIIFDSVIPKYNKTKSV